MVICGWTVAYGCDFEIERRSSSNYCLIFVWIDIEYSQACNTRISPVYTVIFTSLKPWKVKVFLVGSIGGIIERMPRLSGAMVPLFIQNTAVVISAAFLAWIVSADNAPLPAWGLFTIVTLFSSVAVLASV